MTFGNSPVEKWHETGNDRNSILTDPLFVSPKEIDFQLQSNSPALKIGFEPIDLSRVGIRSKRSR
jgi:hypothetical protein